MDGETALDYSRQRKQFADGDFARIRHQQQVIKAILDKAVSGGIVTNPGRLNSFVKATSSAVAVDEKMSLVGMATDLRNLRGRNLTFVTSPTKGTGRVGTRASSSRTPRRQRPSTMPCAGTPSTRSSAPPADPPPGAWGGACAQLPSAGRPAFRQVCRRNALLLKDFMHKSQG